MLSHERAYKCRVTVIGLASGSDCGFRWSGGCAMDEPCTLICAGHVEDLLLTCSCVYATHPFSVPHFSPKANTSLSSNGGFW